VKTILDLLQSLDDMDNELTEFSPTAHKEIMENTKEKVDAYYFVLQRFEEREAALRKIQKETCEKIARVMQARERVKDYLKFCSKHFNLNKFTGNDFQFTVSTRRMLEITARPEDFKDHPFVTETKSYKWSRPDVEAEFRANPESLAGIAQEKEVESIRFGLRH